MLEVLPTRDKTLQESLCLRCGIDFNSELMAYAAYIDGKPYGICQFSVNAELGKLTDIAQIRGSRDNDLLFALGLAAINFMDACGAQVVICDSRSIDNSLLLSLGFSQKSDGIYENTLLNT